MKYGRHSAAVDEVIECVRAGLLLRGGSPPPNVAVLHDFNSARRYAWENTTGVDECLWTDLRELEMARVKEASYAIVGFDTVREKLSSLLKNFTLLVRRSLAAEHRELQDDVVGDLYNCAIARAVFGADSGFFEVLFGVYRTGGWPCGWDGYYPTEGRVVAFFPVSECEPAV